MPLKTKERKNEKKKETEYFIFIFACETLKAEESKKKGKTIGFRTLPCRPLESLTSEKRIKHRS